MDNVETVLSTLIGDRYFRLEPLKIAAELDVATEHSIELTIKGFAKALSLFCELYERLESQFPENIGLGVDRTYLDKQKLNVMQRMVERCLPDFPKHRATAYFLLQAHEAGYTTNIKDFIRGLGGFVDPIEAAVTELVSPELHQQYFNLERLPSK